jgi:hypothetical protein
MNSLDRYLQTRAARQLLRASVQNEVCHSQYDDDVKPGQGRACYLLAATYDRRAIVDVTNPYRQRRRMWHAEHIKTARTLAPAPLPQDLRHVDGPGPGRFPLQMTMEYDLLHLLIGIPLSIARRLINCKAGVYWHGIDITPTDRRTTWPTPALLSAYFVRWKP